MFPFIVADIGGTNARFALVLGKHGEQFQIEQIKILKGQDYALFEDALAAYIETLGGLVVHSACVAIAAPIDGDLVSMTNLSWSFSQESVKKKFGFKMFAAINDYTSVAVATSRLGADDLLEILPGSKDKHGIKAVLGPGTGLGVGGLVSSGVGRWVSIPAEGGHATMGPANAYEAQVIGELYRHFDYVSAETCVSGPGLVNLYRALAGINGEAAQPFEPKDITHHAINHSDKLCREALSLFCAFLGTVASNLALSYGATGGVYITGGVVPRIIDFLKTSEFESRFRNKGVMSHFVEDIPVDLVTYPETAYLGAAAWLEERL